MRTKKFFLALFVLMAWTGANADTLYRITNTWSGKVMTENQSEHTVLCADKSTQDYAQLWYMTGSGSAVTLKNALSQRIIQGTSAFSEQYRTGTTSRTFTKAETGNGTTFTEASNYGLHCDAAYNVVRWMTDEAKSYWTVESVEVDAAELAAARTALQKATNAQLQAVFTDLTCSALKDGYTAAAVAALPASTQALVEKLKADSWATYSGWDKTERAFRIATYKPYSSSSRWTGIMGYGYQMGRLSNPTGIYVKAGDMLQVYVGAIPSGQTVKLEVADYGQGAGTTYSLSAGMNVLQMAQAGNCFVFYEVDNTTNGAAPYKALSSYADVTVHIEGGTVQGYFDLTKGDDNDDWTQLKAHLMTEEMFCLKGRSLVFNLQTAALKNAVDAATGGSRGKLVEMMNYWQGILDMEDELFNRAAIATEEYCNNVHTVTTVGNAGDGSLYASTYGIYFSPEQHDRLFNYKLFSEGSDNLWAAAHELGHHRQTPINMVGNTEISNNVYSNVAVYQQGRYTSRTGSIQETFEAYRSGESWPEQVAKSCANMPGYNNRLLHLNWQLYMFFHINGNKTDFFPQLFDALREDPMVKTAGEGKLTAASTDYLKYYVKCCEVSGYDLTDFFTAYGFFLLPPEQQTAITDGGVTTKCYQTITDYQTYNLYVTQEMIDAAQAEVKAMSGLKQSNIVFIEDRVTAPLATYEGHAEGETKKVNDAVSDVTFGSVGETGQYTDFGATCSDYTYTLHNNKVTMTGTGAVGFIVYDASGKIYGFYNTRSFTLPASLLADGFSIKVAAGDGTITVAPSADTTDSFTVEYGINKGTFYRNGTEAMTSGFVSKWVSTQVAPQVTLTAAYNNINAATGALYSGSSGCTYTLTAERGYIITGYDIAGQSQEGEQTLTPAEGGNAVTFNTSSQSLLSVTGLNSASTSFDQSTPNNGIAISYFNITLEKDPNYVEETYLSDLAELSNGKSYVVTNARATWQFTGTALGTAATHDLTQAAQQVVIYKHLDSYYLYSPAAKKFLSRANTLSDVPYPVQIVAINDTNYPFFFKFDDAHNVNVDGSSHVLIDGWTIQDDGNKCAVIEAADFTEDLSGRFTLEIALNGDGHYATMYLPAGVELGAGTTAYAVTVDGDVARLQEVGSRVPADTPVLLKGTAAMTTATVAQGIGAVNVANALKGTDTQEVRTATGKVYVLNQKDGAVGFFLLEGTLAANRAYLRVEEGSVKGFVLDDGTATAIKELGQSGTLHPAVYDLSGREVVKPSNGQIKKGLYIVNGKKIVK